MQAEIERCAREGTPRPESSAVRAHVPAAFWFFANCWRDLFREGIVDHSLKELCRVYISRIVKCEYCGNQRSEKGARAGARGGPVRRAAQLRVLRRASTSARRPRSPTPRRSPGALETDDAFWERMYAHFSEPELVELGCMIGLTLGQQSWLRLLNIDHHQYMAGDRAAMAPGLRDRRGARGEQGRRRLLGAPLDRRRPRRPPARRRGREPGAAAANDGCAIRR